MVAKLWCRKLCIIFFLEHLFICYCIFAELHFAEKLCLKSIEIYETYNAGAVVRILAYCTISVAGDDRSR